MDKLSRIYSTFQHREQAPNEKREAALRKVLRAALTEFTDIELSEASKGEPSLKDLVIDEMRVRLNKRNRTV